MITLREEEKADVAVRVDRKRGSGGFTITNPQVRILGPTRLLLAGRDWAPCSLDSQAHELSYLFDSTLDDLALGTFYVQFRCTIGTETPRGEVMVRVMEFGP